MTDAARKRAVVQAAHPNGSAALHRVCDALVRLPRRVLLYNVSPAQHRSTQ